MQKTPVINGALLARSLKRFWPLWLSILIAWTLLYLAPFISMTTSFHDYEDLSTTLVWQSMCSLSAPLICVLSIVPALLLNERLFSSKAATFYGSAPQSRRTLFFTTYVASLAPLAIIELLVAFALAVLVAPIPHISTAMVCEWFCFALACTFVFTALAQLVCELTGSRAIAAFLYALLNVLVVCLVTAVWLISRGLIYGLSVGYPDLFWTSPLFALMQYSLYGVNVSMTDVGCVRWPVVLGYCLAAILFMVAAFMLDKRRAAECAGEVVAFSWLRPILKYLAGVCASLFLGVVACTVLSQNLLTGVPFGMLDAFATAVTMMVGAFLGMLFAQMVLDRTARVFRSVWRGGFLVACLACLFVGIAYADPLAVQNRVPDAKDVASVELQEYGARIADVYTYEGIESVCALHQDILAQRDSLVVSRGQDAVSSEVGIVYHMNNGSTIRRAYPVSYPVDAETGQPEKGSAAYEVLSRAYAIADDSQVKSATISREYANPQDGDITIMLYQPAGEDAGRVPDDGTITYEEDMTDGGKDARWIVISLSSAQASDFIDKALLPDIENIHITAWMGQLGEASSTELQIDVSLSSSSEGSYNYFYYDVDTERTPNTVAWLAKNYPGIDAYYTQSGKKLSLRSLA